MDAQNNQQGQTEIYNQIVDSVENLYTNFFNEVENTSEKQPVSNKIDIEEYLADQLKAKSPVRVAPMGCVMTPQGLICD